MNMCDDKPFLKKYHRYAGFNYILIETEIPLPKVDSLPLHRVDEALSTIFWATPSSGGQCLIHHLLDLGNLGFFKPSM